MDTPVVLFYDGSSARPTLVRVLAFEDRLELYDAEQQHLLHRFSLAGATHHRVGDQHYVYLDRQGLVYVQFAGGHPLAEGLVEQLEAANPSLAGRLMRQRVGVLVPLMLVLAAGLYFLLISLVPFLGTRLIGVEQEELLGERVYALMMEEGRLMGQRIDTAGTARLQAFADQLELSEDYAIRVTLVESSTVNAYALPGGRVVVFRGIVDKLESPEALAALLAHEATHVNERHSLKGMLRSMAHALLVSVVFGDVTGVSGALVSNAEAINGLHYSRRLEAEADQKGMELLVANGVPAQGMAELMEMLHQQGEVKLPEALEFLSSHPLTEKRIEAAKRYAQGEGQEVNEELRRAFEALKESGG